MWLKPRQSAELRQTTPQNMTLHIKAIYEEGESAEAATGKEYLQVRAEGDRHVRRSVTNLRYVRLFCQAYASRGPEIRHLAGDELEAGAQTERHRTPCDVSADLSEALDNAGREAPIPHRPCGESPQQGGPDALLEELTLVAGRAQTTRGFSPPTTSSRLGSGSGRGRRIARPSIIHHRACADMA